MKKALTRIQIVWKLQRDWLYLFACSYRLSLLLVFVRSKAKHDLGMENTKQLFLYIIYIHVVNTGNGQSFFCLTGMDIRAGRRRTQCLSNIEKHTHTLTRSGSPLSEWWKSKTWSHLISLSDMFVPVGPETDEDTQKRLHVCVCVCVWVSVWERVRESYLGHSAVSRGRLMYFFLPSLSLGGRRSKVNHLQLITFQCLD